MGEIVITYLNLDVLQKMLTNTSSASQTLALPDTTVLLTASLPPQNFATSLARKLLKNRKTPGHDVGRDLERVAGFKREQQQRQSLETHTFLSYAQEHWLSHTESFRTSDMDFQDVTCYNLWIRLIDGGVPTVDLPWTSQDALALNPSFLSVVAQSHNPALMEYACVNLVSQTKTFLEIQRFVDLLPPYELGFKERVQGSYYDVVLFQAVLENNKDLVQLLLEKTPADVNSHVIGYGIILNVALRLGNLDIVEHLIWHGADVNAKAVDIGEEYTAMDTAARSSVGKEAVLLLLANGAAKIPILDSFSDNVKRVLQESYDLYDGTQRGDMLVNARVRKPF